jgi:NAD(P)H-dependent FMN reductase
LTTIAVITGNPKPSSRTHSVAVAVSDLLAKETGESADRIVIDLADYAPRLFDWSDPELTRLTAEVAAADIAIFASPTYKATYTGLLKAFLDRYPGNGLATCSRSRSTSARSWSSWPPPSPPAASTSPSPSWPTWTPPSPSGPRPPSR